MTTAAYGRVIAAPPRDRLDMFLAAANRLGAPVGHVEKDFWVCWTLNALFRGTAPPEVPVFSSRAAPPCRKHSV